MTQPDEFLVLEADNVCPEGGTADPFVTVAVLCVCVYIQTTRCCLVAVGLLNKKMSRRAANYSN